MALSSWKHFWFSLCVTSGGFEDGQQLAEDKFCDALKEVRQVLSPEMNQVLNRCSKSPPFDWKQLLSITSELAKGNLSVIKERKVEATDLKEILECPEKHAKETVQGQLESEAQGAYSDILEEVGLRQFFPSKLSVFDVLIIRNSYADTELTDLPRRMIQKLFMINFHARDSSLDNSTPTCSGK